MSDNLPFLETEEPAEVIETPTQEPAQAETAQQPTEAEPVEKPERPRGPDGKFLPKEETTKPEPVMVPIAALHETRDKVRDLEAKLQQMQPPQEPQQQVPDIFEDPKGYQEFQDQKLQTLLYQERYRFSERLAVNQYGQDAVKNAVEWAAQRAQQDPHFNAQAFSNPDPVGFAVEQYKRDQVASQVDLSEFEKFKAWQAAQAETQQPIQQQPQNAPPASIASLPSSGGADHTPVGPGQAFDSLFRS
jgi:hypothetical protein